MEWRIILPVLCLIAATTSPTSVMSQTANQTAPAKVAKINLHFSIAQEFKENYTNLNDPETKSLTSNITSEFFNVYKQRFRNFFRMDIKKFSNGSIVVDSVLEFDSTNGSTPNATEVKGTLVAAIRSGNITFNITESSISATDITETNATTSPPPVTNQTAPAKVAKINLGFSITQTFLPAYADLNSAEAKNLSKNITDEFSNVYKKRFRNFFRMDIKKFSNGSIVVDSVLEFDSTNGSTPNATEVKGTLVEAINSGIFSFKVSNSSISATDITETNATTSPPPVTNQTVTPVTNQTAPAKVAKINLGFSIAQEFKDIYSDLNNDETKNLSNSITNVFTLVYKRSFAKFYRMLIRKFSKGSVVVDSVLEFDATSGSTPNATEVKNTLVAAIRSGNITFNITESSISATDITETNVSAASAVYNITFKLTNEVFQNDLSNISSDAAKKLAKNITTELDGFCKGFRNFNSSKVLGFRSGSVLVDGQLGFNSAVNNPSALEIAKGIAAAVRNGTVKLAIDPASINVTDSTGTTANRSPVLASMLTALWMTLASLLLSAVMH